jgi:hypothetical protein
MSTIAIDSIDVFIKSLDSGSDLSKTIKRSLSAIEAALEYYGWESLVLSFNVSRHFSKPFVLA